MTLNEKIEHICNDIIVEKELPARSVHLTSNKSKNNNETSKSVCIDKPEYPSLPKKKSTTKSERIINIRYSNNDQVELIIPKKQFSVISEPLLAIVKEVKDNEAVHILFPIDSEDLLSYIKENIVYCIDNYVSSNSFCCCSKYEKCSDAKKCLHENKLYATGCFYRHNLEKGIIFYGKNKNID